MQPILTITQPRLPRFRFEWHPGRQNVYVVRVGMKPEIGEIIQHHVTTAGQAHNAVLCWCRGYLTRHVEIDAGATFHNRSLME